MSSEDMTSDMASQDFGGQDFANQGLANQGLAHRDLPKFGDTGMGKALTSLGAVTKPAPAIAGEVSDYAQKSAQGTGVARAHGCRQPGKSRAVRAEYVEVCHRILLSRRASLARFALMPPRRPASRSLWC